MSGPLFFFFSILGTFLLFSFFDVSFDSLHSVLPIVL